jgi:hypothetical protein
LINQLTKTPPERLVSHFVSRTCVAIIL